MGQPKQWCSLLYQAFYVWWLNTSFHYFSGEKHAADVPVIYGPACYCKPLKMWSFMLFVKHSRGNLTSAVVARWLCLEIVWQLCSYWGAGVLMCLNLSVCWWMPGGQSWPGIFCYIVPRSPRRSFGAMKPQNWRIYTENHCVFWLMAQ